MNRVSVIMPNYNHAPFLKERMESILAQDYREIEIILLDDASTDDSAAVLREYAKHPNVKVLLSNITNSGNTFVQWQHGLEQATGEYIWIAESDDVAQPHLLTTLIQEMEQSNAVLAFCASRKIDENGVEIPHAVDRVWQHDFCMDGGAFVKKYLLGYSHICNASAVVFRREAASHVHWTDVQQYPASGDRLFWIELAMQGKVCYVAQAMNGFRQHSHKVSGSAEYRGLNMQQDHAIYCRIKEQIALTHRQRRLICGYHWQAIHQPAVSAEGQKQAIKQWASEPEFGRGSFWWYMVYRLLEKTGIVHR